MSHPQADPALTPIPYGRQHITAEDRAAVDAVLQSDFLTQGPQIPAFEEAFAQYIGAPHAVAVANGTAALHLAVLALGLKPGQRVIVPPITFTASANCVRYAGGLPYFVDIDPTTLCLDPAAVRSVLQAAEPGSFAGIVAVDFAGYPVDLVALRAIADEYSLWLLEDSCHAPGGYLEQNSTQHRCGDGSLADAAIFSFHPVKHIATGEGGMVTTARPEVAERVQLLRTHGITKDPALLQANHGGWYYEQQALGYNYRLSDMQAALGLSQLKRAEAGLARREAIAQAYDEAFAGHTSIACPPRPQGQHAWHLYPIQVADSETRLGLYNHLREAGIYAQVHYIPLHTLPYYRELLTDHHEDLLNAEAYYAGCLSLPMYPTLTDAQQAYVIQQVTGYLKEA